MQSHLQQQHERMWGKATWYVGGPRGVASASVEQSAPLSAECPGDSGWPVPLGQHDSQGVHCCVPAQNVDVQRPQVAFCALAVAQEQAWSVVENQTCCAC